VIERSIRDRIVRRLNPVAPALPAQRAQRGERKSVIPPDRRKFGIAVIRRKKERHSQQIICRLLVLKKGGNTVQ